MSTLGVSVVGSALLLLLAFVTSRLLQTHGTWTGECDNDNIDDDGGNDDDDGYDDGDDDDDDDDDNDTDD